jgi:hypothetical protein
VPFLVDEVLPGDSYKVKFNFLARLSTPVVPTMDNLFLDTFYLFVPYRLLWKHWEQFNGQQDYPGASTDYLVPQTSAPVDGGFPVGSLEDYGLVSSTSAKHGFTKSFVEHGIIIGLLNVRADLTYQQGIPRMFSRRTRFDFYWPVFAHLGEQATKQEN